MYSVFAAEVPLEDGPNTQFNYLLLKQLQEQTKVLFYYNTQVIFVKYFIIFRLFPW